MTLAMSVLIGLGVFSFFTSVSFFGTVIYVAKIFSNIIAWTVAALIALGVLKAFKASKKVVIHAKPDQSPT